jgi:hypothetical protein
MRDVIQCRSICLSHSYVHCCVYSGRPSKRAKTVTIDDDSEAELEHEPSAASHTAEDGDENMNVEDDEEDEEPAVAVTSDVDVEADEDEEPSTSRKSSFIDDEAEEASDDSSDSHTDDEAEAIPAPVTSPIRKAVVRSVQDPAAVPLSPVRAPASKSPHASPVKVWRPPVTDLNGSTFPSADGSGLVPGNSKVYKVKVLLVGDLAFSQSSASRVARKTVIAFNLEKEEPMIITGWAEDATKYMANLKQNECYMLHLVSKGQAPNRPQCLPELTVYFTVCKNTTIKQLPLPVGEEDDLAAKHVEVTATSLFMKPISAIAGKAAESFVNFIGMVFSVSQNQSGNSKFQNSVKVTLIDSTAQVSVMFFEGKNLQVGDVVSIVGAKVWVNSKTTAKEVSIWNTAVVCVNQDKIHKSTQLKGICRTHDASALVNISAIATHEIRRMSDLKDEAALLENESDVVSGTVMLRLDSHKQSQNGSVTYNGCHVCMKKVQLSDDVNAEGNPYFVHVVDSGHKSLLYVAHYFFTGRFKESHDEGTVHLGQVDDTIGFMLFGMTADQLNEESQEKQVEVLKKACEGEFRFNVDVMKNGSIASLVLV